MKKNKINKKTIKWLMGITATAKGSLTLLFTVKVLQGIVGIGFAFLLRTLIDAATGGDTDTLFTCIWIGCGIVAAEIVLYWLAIYYKEKPTAKLIRNIRSRIFCELLSRSYGDVSGVHTGEWMTRINSDARIVASAITSIVPGAAGLIVQIVCAFAAMFLVLPQMAWALIPVSAAMIAVSLGLRIRLKAFHKEVQRNEGISYSFIQESLASMPIIRTFTRELKTGDEAHERLDNVVDAKLRRARFVSNCATTVYALIRISYFLGVGICSIKILNGIITYGMMAAVLQLIAQVEAPLAEVTTAVPQFYNMAASAERIMEAEQLEPDYTGKVKTAEEARRYYEKELFSIGLKDVCFSYRSSDDPSGNVLDGMNLEIFKGDYVAFTGESGCGKSTTMKILMSLYRPDEGRLFIKSINNKEKELNALWRALFAYVPQENLLMSGRIRDVVAFADPAACYHDEEILQALKIACAESFVIELPEGLDTELGERGAGLSEGQMQRLAIARAVFSRRPVLMLDEATSALDEATEKQLLDNLKSMTDRTVVIITHRPAALNICTRRIHFSKTADDRPEAVETVSSKDIYD